MNFINLMNFNNNYRAFLREVVGSKKSKKVKKNYWEECGKNWFVVIIGNTSY